MAEANSSANQALPFDSPCGLYLGASETLWAWSTRRHSQPPLGYDSSPLLLTSVPGARVLCSVRRAPRSGPLRLAASPSAVRDLSLPLPPQPCVRGSAVAPGQCRPRGLALSTRGPDPPLRRRLSRSLAPPSRTASPGPKATPRGSSPLGPTRPRSQRHFSLCSGWPQRRSVLSSGCRPLPAVSALRRGPLMGD